MSFTSVSFLVFIAASILIYFILPKRFQWVVLLAASYCFYMLGGPAVVVYLLITTFTTYIAGLVLGKLEEKHYKKLVVLLAVLINIGMLVVLKYLDHTVSGYILPLGVSFYIFQSIGYVVDVYRKKHPPQKNIGKYALFVSFFPQIVQGPISRYNQLADQLTAERSIDWDKLKYGIQLAMWGYFKKMVIAERAGVVVSTVFANHTAYDGAITAFSVLFYCFQLYCDFSGGIDISRGVASMFGIEMIDNFRRPMFAISLTDYWRRWHISLGAWLKDYVFYPLSLSKPFRRLGRFTRSYIGGTLGKIFPTSLATFIIYFLIGVWHGANFRYIFYGFWNGAIITSSLILAQFYAATRDKLNINEESTWLFLLRMVRTWILVFIGRYITRAPRLLVAFAMLRTTFTNFKFASLIDGTVLNLGLSGAGIIIVFLGMSVIVCAETFQERGIELRKSLETKHFFIQWMAILVPLVVILLLGAMNQEYIPGQFIYAQF